MKTKAAIACMLLNTCSIKASDEFKDCGVITMTRYTASDCGTLVDSGTIETKYVPIAGCDSYYNGKYQCNTDVMRV